VRARIEKIDLSLGDLSGADLRGATLEDVIADNARFEGCSFSDNMDSKGTDLAKQDAEIGYRPDIIVTLSSGSCGCLFQRTESVFARRGIPADSTNDN